MIYKIISVGDTGIGKTCIFNRFGKNIYEECIPITLGVDFMVRDIMIQNQDYKLQMWDLGGMEKFRNIIRSYYRNTHGIMLVYDITNRDSFLHLKHWLDDISDIYDIYKFTESPAIIIIGTKLDMKKNRVITYDEAKKFADNYGIKDVIECSSKSGENINKIFEVLSLRIDEKVNLGYMDIKSTDKFTLIDIETENDLNKMATCCQII